MLALPVNPVLHIELPADARLLPRTRRAIDAAVTVQIDDDGVGFDPFQVPLEPADPEDVSGRGLAIIRHPHGGAAVAHDPRRGHAGPHGEGARAREPISASATELRSTVGVSPGPPGH